MLNYILWSTSPEIYSIGSFSLRWYGLFFATGFLVSQQALYYIYKKEGKPQQDVDTLTIYMVIATIVGARLGHVIFYQQELITNDPWSLFLPFEFSPFKFTGLQGLASHGAAIGILFALWLYSRKRKPGQTYLQVVDRIVILVAFTGALIRLGNYYNAEIIGKATDKPWGVVFTGRLTEALHSQRIDTDNVVESVGFIKNDTASTQGLRTGVKPMFIYIFFEKGTTDEQVDRLINGNVHFVMTNRLYEYFDENSLRLNYVQATTDDGQLVARISTLGIARHPAQLYEAISCVFLSLFLFWIWWKHKENLPPGRLLGWFLIICFGLRFVYELFKINQVSFEQELPINMGQILSIPLFLAGIVILFRSYKKGIPSNAEN